MLGLFRKTLARIVETGNVTLIDHTGSRHRFGDGAGTPVAFKLHDPALYRKLIFDPQLQIGEAYMDGTLTVEQGTLYDMIEVLTANIAKHSNPSILFDRLAGFRYLTRRFQQFNRLKRSRRNVAHHYDLDSGIYDLFLDEDLQYSCGYFRHHGDTLEDAQLAKKRHLAAKMDIKSGQKILDLGCGWGGLALYLAGVADVEVVGITLSERQLEIARERARKLGLHRRVEFRLQDYRTLDERFDRIVSVGMFEHVGINHYGGYFQKINELLGGDGVALVHSIGRADGPSFTNPWIAKYIFPGGYIPAMSEVIPAIEQTGLYCTDIEVLRLHYAETLKAWRQRFVAAWDEAARIYDERFCRMWEFYLAASEASFRYQHMIVFQMQMSPSLDALPLTRDYISENEEELLRGGESLIGHRIAGE